MEQITYKKLDTLEVNTYLTEYYLHVKTKY